MNILIEEKHHESLQRIVIDTVEFGAVMKGRGTEDSDKDLLHFIHTPECIAQGFLNTDHQLQYKEGNVDHIYTTLPLFFKSLITGDAIINHEILRWGALKETFLGGFNFSAEEFATYPVLRAYLGLAKRDIADVGKLFKKDQRKAAKKIVFVQDGLNYVAAQLGKDFVGGWDGDLGEYQDIRRWKGMMTCEYELMRDSLNKRLEGGSYPRHIPQPLYEAITYCIRSESCTIPVDSSIMDYYYKSYKGEL